MAETDILRKLDDAFNTLSQERKAIVVPLVEMIQKAGLDKKQISNYEKILNSSGNFKLDYKKEGILVNRKNFKPMEKPMSTPKNTTNTNAKLHDRIKALRDALSEGLYEKEEAVRLALLTAIAGESIFFLGDPGCAKSMIARRIVKAFKADGDDKVKYFETLLNAYTTPDEVFGNVSLKGLNGELPECKDKEVYRRLTEGMLPEADIAFLDEIWKANSTILNSLLTIVNERKFHNGNEVKDVPLKALFTASNELPAKGQGLEALYDRLILRLVVSFIDDEDNFFEMVNAPSSTEFKVPEDVKKLQISNAELKGWKEKIDEVSLSDAAKSVISAIRKELVSRNEAMSEEDKQKGEIFEVGDRRWKKIVHILKTSAFLNDRTEVDLMDCQLIEYCIWSTEKQQKVAREIVEKCIQQNGLDCDTAIHDIKGEIFSFNQKIDETFYEPEYETVKGQAITSTINNETCYKVEATDGTIYFVGKTYYYTSVQGNNRRSIYNNSMKKNGSTISWMYDYYNSMSGQILRNPDTTKQTGNLTKNSLFSNKSAFTATQKSFDEKYNDIKSKIAIEIKGVETFMSEQSAPYKANLFADQHYCDVIMNAVTEAKRDLQNAQVDLDKKRSRYQD
ncbi:MAG: AAA family ATPase [Fibrobacter sp.]|nr:AAA family ATPase [Fibrobacter sp.]